MPGSSPYVFCSRVASLLILLHKIVHAYIDLPRRKRNYCKGNDYLDVIMFRIKKLGDNIAYSRRGDRPSVSPCHLIEERGQVTVNITKENNKL
jgi:hypothetical protein